jgi:ribose 5-phosphate isomerase A
MSDARRIPDARERARRTAAAAALRFVEPGTIVGVGTGRTAAAFIVALRDADRRPAAAVASSQATERSLIEAGIDVVPLPVSGRIPLYVDGADAADPALRLIKGAGGAHAREKVLASASALFVCIVDDSKPAISLEEHVVPVEVLPMARAYVAEQLSALGADVAARDGFVTDNGNEVLDARGLDFTDPGSLERRIEVIPGVVACGIFALRPADVLLVGHDDGSVSESHRRH